MIRRFTAFYQSGATVRQSLKYARSSTKGNRTKSFHWTDLEIFLRSNKADAEVFEATFLKGYHRSPFKLGKSPLIIDLGSNIGLTLLDFGLQYPDAKLFGMEPDSSNIEICRKNCAPLPDCTITHGAVWKQDGTIDYAGPDEQSYQMQAASFGKGKIPCVTMQTYLQAMGNPEVDFLKMDIEGAEYAILLESTELDWLGKIKMIMIEVHDTADQDKESGALKIRNVLTSHGFTVYPSASHWSALFAIASTKLPA